MTNRTSRSFVASAALVAGVIAAGMRLILASRVCSFAGRVVVITGGSRGLGLTLARQLVAQGARVAMLARSKDELERAGDDLRKRGGEALGVQCDVTDRDQVENAMREVVERFGGIDLLINNAGIILVGPFEHMETRDYEHAMAVHFFGPLNTTLAVLPYMRKAGGGRIVNITSVGGKIAAPHLLPYTASKFALVGLSQGLTSELRRYNIYVTTVCPGLMRTGSTGQARFKGQHRREHAWFTLADSLPLLSMSAERAAAKIIRAARNGSPRLVLGVQTKAAVLASELFPGMTAEMLAAINHFLPGPVGPEGNQVRAGYESQSSLAPSALTALNEIAATRNNERP